MKNPVTNIAEHRFPVMEHFYTIQGEGYHSGKPAYFIRLGGCDVGCVWCDVKESWDAAKHNVYDVNEITSWATTGKVQNVVVTGGEPLMYNLDSLCKAVHDAGKNLFLETSGAYALSGKWDWVCVSPKKFMPPLAEVLQCADELKVVVYNKNDFDWALQHAAKVKESCKLFLQPEHSVFEKVIPMIVDFVKNDPRWSISLQTHKFMHIP